MKIIPEHSTSLIHQENGFRIRLDAGACCFFVLGMFLCAVIFHQISLFAHF